MTLAPQSVSGTLEVVSFQTRYLRARNPGAPVGSLLPERQYKALRLFRSVLPVFIIVLILMRVWSMMALQVRGRVWCRLCAQLRGLRFCVCCSVLRGQKPPCPVALPSRWLYS